MKLKSTLIMSSLFLSTLSSCNLLDEKKEADIDNSVCINRVETEEEADIIHCVKNEEDINIEVA